MKVKVRNFLADNPIVREFVYLILTAVAIQLVTGLGDLLKTTETVDSISTLWASITVWLAAFVQAFVLTLFRQVVGFVILKLLGFTNK